MAENPFRDSITTGTCRECRYYYEGFCRRYPPVPMFHPAEFEDVAAGVQCDPYSEHPNVSPDYWCGEFRNA